MRAIDSIAARSVSQGGMRLSQCVGMELAMRSMSWRLRVSEFFYGRAILDEINHVEWPQSVPAGLGSLYRRPVSSA